MSLKDFFLDENVLCLYRFQIELKVKLNFILSKIIETKAQRQNSDVILPIVVVLILFNACCCCWLHAMGWQLKGFKRRNIERNEKENRSMDIDC